MRTAPARLGIGTATFLESYGFSATSRPTVSLLREAISRGVGYVDTASGYGDSERAIGELASELASAGTRICTKVAPASLNASSLEAELRASLSRLNASAVDTLLIHNLTRQSAGADAVDRAWDAVRRQGTARRTGASTYGVDDAIWAIGSQWCDTIQVEYSVLNQSVVRAIEPLKRAGQEVVVRSVLCKGLLTTGALDKPLRPEVAAKLRPLEAWAQACGMTLPALAIRFALDTPGVDVVLVGVASAEELNEALAASELPPLTADQYRTTAAFDAAGDDWTHPERWTNGTLTS